MSDDERRPAGMPEKEQRPAGAPEAPVGPVPEHDPDAAPEAPDPDVDEREDAETDERGDAEAVEHDLDAMLAETKRERDEYLELARRARADFENYRKRAARDTSEAERRGKASVARDLVPILDNLERAVIATGVDPEGPTEAEAQAATQEVSQYTALAQGVALVYRELRAAFERAGVEPYDPVGERFDPSWHEALSKRPADDVESGHVVETLQKGYRLDGQVLRAARVVVAE